MAEAVALAGRVVAAAAVVGAAETVAPELPTIPVGATMRIRHRAHPSPALVAGVTEPVAAADREAAATTRRAADLGTRLGPAATVGTAVGVARRADAAVAAVGRVQDALAADALLARRARVRIVAGVRAGATRGETGGHQVPEAARSHPTPAERRPAAVAEAPAHSPALAHQLPPVPLAVTAAAEEGAAAVVRWGTRQRRADEQHRQYEDTRHDRRPSPTRFVRHLDDPSMQPPCTTSSKALPSHPARQARCARRKESAAATFR